MDDVRGFEHERSDTDDDTRAAEPASPPAEAADASPAVAIGGDERRMHVRAYNHWVSLLDGRAYPSIANLDPAGIADFGTHSVLIDFTRGAEDPVIAFLGRALRDECAIDASITRIADVPGRSLLSRLTDHYLQIIANRAPVGFEAEFTGTRGHNTMYRGILMPFSSNGDAIDYIYGVINWKEMVDAATQAALDAEIAAALSAPAQPVATAPVWADGPGAQAAPAAPSDLALSDWLAAARASAGEAAAAHGRSRAALYDALGQAHDFAVAAAADADGYATLLASAGIAVQARAPLTAVAKLVFGTEVGKARLTEYAAVLGHARRHAVPPGTLPQYLGTITGGMKAVVAAERSNRRGAVPARSPSTRQLDAKPALASVHVPVGVSAGYVLLLGRIAGDAVEIIADVTEATPLARAMRRAA